MQLLKIRYYQARRDLGYWIFLIVIAAFYTAWSIASVSVNYSMYLAAVVFLLLQQYHSRRKDLNFILKYLEHPRLQVSAGYNLLILPVTLAMLFQTRWEQALGLHLFVTSLAFFSFRVPVPPMLFIGRLVPPAQFEWISGLRKNFYLVLLLMLLAIALSPVKLFGVAALFLLNSIFLGFYGFFEPRMMLNPEALEVNRFLNRKVSFSCKIILISNAPLLLLNSIFHPEVAFINLGFLAGFLILAGNMVFLKYAGYRPNENLSANADLLILYVSVFIPYLLPLGILLYFHNRKKAVNNLLNYF